MKKIKVLVHPEAAESLKRYKDDLKAGHLDAAEYWRGQAGAYFTANPISGLNKFRALSISKNKRFTGTKGEIDAIDDVKLFKKCYIDNTIANLQSFKWMIKNFDAKIEPNDIDKLLHDFKVAKSLTLVQWKQYINVFKKSSMIKIPLVSDIVKSNPKKKIILTKNKSGKVVITKRNPYKKVCAKCGAKIYSSITPVFCPKCRKPWKEKKIKI